MSWRQTVVGVVYQGNEFFLIKKPHWKWWDFPQGGVAKGENLEDALMRELREELGINRFGKPEYTDITLRRKFSPETFAYYLDEGYIGKDLFYFIVEFLGDRGCIRLGDNIVDQMWCGEEKLFSSIYEPELEVTRRIIRFMTSKNFL